MRAIPVRHGLRRGTFPVGKGGRAFSRAELRPVCDVRPHALMPGRRSAPGHIPRAGDPATKNPAFRRRQGAFLLPRGGGSPYIIMDPSPSHAKQSPALIAGLCPDCQKKHVHSYSHSPSADDQSKIGEPHRGGKRGDAPARRFSCFPQEKFPFVRELPGAQRPVTGRMSQKSGPKATFLTR